MTTTSSKPAPTADWVDPEAMMRDPYDTYERLRELGAAVWVPAMQQYLVTSFDACQTMEADQDTYSVFINRGSGATMARALGTEPMLGKDDPGHAVERKPINPTMRPKRIRDNWVPLFERNARTYLDALIEQGPEKADLNHDYAAPLAAHNLTDMLGLRECVPADMQRWSHAFIAGIGNLHDDTHIWGRCDDAQQEVDSLLDELIPYYRQHPDSSLTSALANSGISDTAVRANVKLIISGGMNEPQHMITNMVWALSRHPDLCERVLADPTLWSATFDEALRWLAPIGFLGRETTRTTVLAGIELPAHAGVGIVIGAANRDPAVFDRPAAFDIFRPKQPHLGFGNGAHLCAGHWAARIGVGEISVPLLYRHLPGLRTDPSRQEQWYGWVFRGLTSLPITWDVHRALRTGR